VNITKRIDALEGERYCPVVVGPNGRIKPDWVMVNDRQENTLKVATTSTDTKTESADACPSAQTQRLRTTGALENKESWMRSQQVSLFSTPSKTTPASESAPR
jgi:hypothetical protein